MKFNITLDDRLAERVDEYADAHYMTRSGFISMACFQFLQSQEVAKSIVDMATCMKKIAEKGTVDQETMTELENMMHLTELIKDSGLIR